MNVLVCVKQVPDTIKVAFDGERHILRRNEEVPPVINPFDLYAMEAAARLKDADPSCHIVALCMGPESAASVLRDALAIGADEACLVTGESFAGSDAIATAYALSAAIDEMEKQGGRFDAIFCGAKTTDGGTSSVAVLLAGIRGVPALTYALQCEREGDGLRVLQECDEAKLVFRIPFSCVVSFTKATFSPRYPLMARVIAAQSQEIRRYSEEALEGAGGSGSVESLNGRVGVAGSRTRVETQRYRELKKVSRMIKAKNQENGARKLAQMMSEAHVI